jgi:hypothetical protein
MLGQLVFGEASLAGTSPKNQLQNNYQLTSSVKQNHFPAT